MELNTNMVFTMFGNVCFQPGWSKVFLAAIFTFICSLIYSRLGHIDDLSIIPTIAKMIVIIFATNWCILKESIWLSGSRIGMVFYVFLYYKFDLFSSLPINWIFIDLVFVCLFVFVVFSMLSTIVWAQSSHISEWFVTYFATYFLIVSMCSSLVCVSLFCRPEINEATVAPMHQATIRS